MPPARLLIDEREISDRLAEFGVSRAELVEIVRAVVAARADAVEDDPASAEGQFAYIFGTRYLRQIFRAKGWLLHRENNVESVKHPERDLKIVYQSVDLAAERRHTPRAISGKGSGADRLISAGQGCLFEEDESAALYRRRLTELRGGVWFLCVSVDGEDVRAELSLPSGVSAGNFDGFIERIFVLSEGEWEGVVVADGDNSDAAEFEPAVSRK